MKIRKKRVVYGIAVLLTLGVGVFVDWFLALFCITAFVLLLSILAVYRRLTAHRGFKKLDPWRKACAVPALIERAESLAQKAEAFTVVVLGDTRNKREITEQVYQEAAGDHPVAVFHTGDIVRHGTAQEFIEHHLSLLPIFDPAPMFCAAGNHERGARKDFAAFKYIYGTTRFAVTLGPALFIGVNNSRKGRVSSDDFAFIEHALAESQARYRFVCFHIPPAFFEGRIVKDQKRRGFTKGAEELHALFQQHLVNEVFMAHIHGYASEVIDGVRYTLTAGGGAPLDIRLAPEGRVHHYIRLQFSPGGASRQVVRLIDDAWVRDAEMPYEPR